MRAKAFRWKLKDGRHFKVNEKNPLAFAERVPSNYHRPKCKRRANGTPLDQRKRGVLLLGEAKLYRHVDTLSLKIDYLLSAQANTRIQQAEDFVLRDGSIVAN